MKLLITHLRRIHSLVLLTDHSSIFTHPTHRSLTNTHSPVLLTDHSPTLTHPSYSPITHQHSLTRLTHRSLTNTHHAITASDTCPLNKWTESEQIAGIAPLTESPQPAGGPTSCWSGLTIYWSGSTSWWCTPTIFWSGSTSWLINSWRSGSNIWWVIQLLEYCQPAGGLLNLLVAQSAAGVSTGTAPEPSLQTSPQCHGMQ